MATHYRLVGERLEMRQFDFEIDTPFGLRQFTYIAPEYILESRRTTREDIMLGIQSMADEAMMNILAALKAEELTAETEG